ncbi:MAG: hypothetical protein CM1200mP3_10650 [Chloroflexota bacterium]|nr:MAG: hypothetical protein CM1200mP3_10650 [Chloroflexota bacterium]
MGQSSRYHLYAREYFGRKSFGKIMGISPVPLMIMTMIAPVLLDVHSIQQATIQPHFFG